MFCTGRLRRAMLLFMVRRHTKFAADVVFIEITERFYRSNIFTKTGLVDMTHSLNLKAKNCHCIALNGGDQVCVGVIELFRI